MELEKLILKFFWKRQDMSEEEEEEEEIGGTWHQPRKLVNRSM